LFSALFVTLYTSIGIILRFLYTIFSYYYFYVGFSTLIKMLKFGEMHE